MPMDNINDHVTSVSLHFLCQSKPFNRMKVPSTSSCHIVSSYKIILASENSIVG